MPLFCCSEPCVPKAHSFQAADSLRLIFKSDKTTPTCHSQPFAEAGLPHPCLSLRYVCATFLLSPKDSESISYIYYGIMTCSFVAQRAQKVHLYMVLCNVPFRPKGPKKYIIPTMLNMFLLGPLSTRSHRTSKSCPLDLLGYIYKYILFIYIYIIILWGTPQTNHFSLK